MFVQRALSAQKGIYLEEESEDDQTISLVYGAREIVVHLVEMHDMHL